MIEAASALDVFQQSLNEWRGGSARLISYEDRRARLSLELTHPTSPRRSVDVDFFDCSFLAGPTYWNAVELVVGNALRTDPAMGYEVRDKSSGFVVRCLGAGIVARGPRAHWPDDKSQAMTE